MLFVKKIKLTQTVYFLVQSKYYITVCDFTCYLALWFLVTNCQHLTGVYATFSFFNTHLPICHTWGDDEYITCDTITLVYMALVLCTNVTQMYLCCLLTLNQIYITILQRFLSSRRDKPL